LSQQRDYNRLACPESTQLLSRLSFFRRSYLFSILNEKLNLSLKDNFELDVIQEKKKQAFNSISAKNIFFNFQTKLSMKAFN
jgi:hypothetical protein